MSLNIKIDKCELNDFDVSPIPSPIPLQRSYSIKPTILKPKKRRLHYDNNRKWPEHDKLVNKPIENLKNEERYEEDKINSDSDTDKEITEFYNRLNAVRYALIDGSNKMRNLILEPAFTDD